jgi:RHS repeat-associated protein
VGGFFSALDEADYLPTWYVSRKDGQLGTAEKDAATKAAAHANTPSVAHLDSLGRTFLTIADNGVVNGLPQPYETHVELDIEGNQLIVTDALNRQVMRSVLLIKDAQGNSISQVNAFDLLSHQLYSHSMDAGERWTLSNVAGKPIRRWDSRNHEVRHTYDPLQRPTQLWVRQGTDPEVLAECIVYGDSADSGLTLIETQAANLRGQVYQHYDGAGVITSVGFDFKGNLLSSRRQLATEYKQQVNWVGLANLTNVADIANAAAPMLETEIFTSSTEYDALNRPTRLITPDDSKIRPTYNEANLLERVEVELRGAGVWTTFVNDIDYDAKGQRQLIEYGSGVGTEYTYDEKTFRLKTTRTGDNARLQNLSYTYDPVGNITTIQDDAQQTVFFDNAVVSPSTEYVYDALYRLIQADGREHAGQAVNPQSEYQPENKPHYDSNDFTRRNLPHPNDGQAMRNYRQLYEYDSVGNILNLIHQANGTTLGKRRYDYAADSNRLLSTSLPSDLDTQPLPVRYFYDEHGSMTQMPHLLQMQWDFKDQLQRVDLGGGGTAYYVYDASGQRVRKVVEKSVGLTEERIYLGGYEIFRRRNGNGLKLERETLHVMDDKRRIALVETKTVDVDTPVVSPVVSPSPLIRYQLDNHLGSASLELDQDGQVISYEEYYPYGNTSYQAGRSVAEVSLKRYRYTGKERDEESGLYYHGARYYAPWLGRWTSCDPLFGGGIQEKSQEASSTEVSNSYINETLYSYAANNPIIFEDPNGKSPQSKAAGGVISKAAQALAKKFSDRFEKAAASEAIKIMRQKAIETLEKEGIKAINHGLDHLLPEAALSTEKITHTVLKKGMTKETFLELIKTTLKEGGYPVLSREAKGKFRFVIEKEFKEAIGEEGQKILKVVIDEEGRPITAYAISTFTKKAKVGGIIVEASIAAFIGVLVAIGEKQANAAQSDAAKRQAIADKNLLSETIIEWFPIPYIDISSSPIAIEPNFSRMREEQQKAVHDVEESLQKTLSFEERQLVMKEVGQIWLDAPYKK